MTNTPEHLATETPNKIIVSPAARKAIYGAAAAIGAVFVVFGFVSQDEVNSILQVIGEILTVLTTLLALVNVPSRR